MNIIIIIIKLKKKKKKIKERRNRAVPDSLYFSSAVQKRKREESDGPRRTPVRPGRSQATDPGPAHHHQPQATVGVDPGQGLPAETHGAEKERVAGERERGSRRGREREEEVPGAAHCHHRPCYLRRTETEKGEGLEPKTCPKTKW